MSNSLREAIAKGIFHRIMEAPETRAEPQALEIPDGIPTPGQIAAKVKKQPGDAEPGEEAPEAEEKVEQVVDEEKTERIRKEYADAAAALANSPVLISTQDAYKLANRIYVAMKGSTSGLMSFNPLKGAGTDESEIRDPLLQCPTLLDVSKVSHEYMKISGGATLEEHLEEELSPAYMNEFVRVPLADKPFININGSEMSHREFNQWVKSNAGNV